MITDQTCWSTSDVVPATVLGPLRRPTSHQVCGVFGRDPHKITASLLASVAKRSADRLAVEAVADGAPRGTERGPGHIVLLSGDYGRIDVSPPSCQTTPPMHFLRTSRPRRPDPGQETYIHCKQMACPLLRTMCALLRWLYAITRRTFLRFCTRMYNTCFRFGTALGTCTACPGHTVPPTAR